MVFPLSLFFHRYREKKIFTDHLKVCWFGKLIPIFAQNKRLFPPKCTANLSRFEPLNRLAKKGTKCFVLLLFSKYTQNIPACVWVCVINFITWNNQFIYVCVMNEQFLSADKNLYTHTHTYRQIAQRMDKNINHI